MDSRSSTIQATRAELSRSKLSTKILSASCLALTIMIGNHHSAMAKSSDFGMCHGQKSQVSTRPAQASKKVYLKNSNGVYIFSDRQESFKASFNRRRIMAGKTIAKYLPQVLEATSLEQIQCFVSYPSFNDDGSGKVTTYGLAFRLAPIPPEIAQLWKNHHQSDISWATILLEQDAQDAKLYHFVGWVDKEKFSFFSDEPEGDSPNYRSHSAFSRKSLWYRASR
jgi:hypothetical protein